MIKRFFVLGVCAVLSGCTHVIKVPIERNDVTISEAKATSINPPQYYVCGDSLHPCVPVISQLQTSIQYSANTHSKKDEVKLNSHLKRSKKHASHVKKVKCYCK